MKPLSDLFEKYRKTIKPPQASVEKECRAVIATVTGFELEDSAVTFTPSTRTLKITAPSVVKQEIKLHQAAILKQLQTKLGASAAPEVIL